MDSHIALLQQWAAALALWRGFQNDRSVWACWPVPAHKPTFTIGRLHAGRPLQAISRLLCPHAWHLWHSCGVSRALCSNSPASHASLCAESVQ